MWCKILYSKIFYIFYQLSLSSRIAINLNSINKGSVLVMQPAEVHSYAIEILDI